MSVGLSTATKVFLVEWGYGLLAGAVAMILASLFYLGRLFGDLQLLKRLQEPRLEFYLKSAPRTWTKGSRNRITINGMLERGASLHSVQMVLFLPHHFAFTAPADSELKPYSDEPRMSNYNAVYSTSFPVLKAEVPFEYYYDDISSDLVGTYPVYGRVISEEYNSPYERIDITVV